jgi:hypothetical protein
MRQPNSEAAAKPEVVNDHPHREQLGQDARDYALAEFTWTTPLKVY